MLAHVEPILAVHNVQETVSYWHDVLGFTTKWTWNEPPTYGGVSWHGVAVQFWQNSELATASKGNSIWVRVRHLESLYRFHKDKQAVIVEPLENKPWGMAGYTVQEINGYYICFAGALLDDKAGGKAPAHTVKIIPRAPSIHEYSNLTAAVGWQSRSDAVIEKMLSAPVYAVVAEDTASGQIVGCALLLGDDASFYYVKDVVVHPDWQRKGVGASLMRALTDWLEVNAAENALVGLITGEGLAPFYQAFDFVPAFCMVRQMHRKEKD